MIAPRGIPSSRHPWIVVSLGEAHKLAEDAQRARQEGADALEIRADLFPKALLKPEPLRSLLKDLRRRTSLVLLLTLRSRAEGGKLPRSVDEQDRLALIRAALSEVDAVDVELSADGIAEHVVDEARKRHRWTVLSFHDFKKIPTDRVLQGIVKRFRQLKGDVLKIAAMPKTSADTGRLMAFCAGLEGRRAIIAMGALGRSSRIEGRKWGSCLTYGYVRRPLAPGQISVKELAKSR